MKKKIVVTFADGTQQSIEAEKLHQAIGPQLIGIPANHEVWLRSIQQIAVNGVIADGANEKYVRYVAPSQIKHVELIFESPDEKTA